MSKADGYGGIFTNPNIKIMREIIHRGDISASGNNTWSGTNTFTGAVLVSGSFVTSSTNTHSGVNTFSAGVRFTSGLDVSVGTATFSAGVDVDGGGIDISAGVLTASAGIAGGTPQNIHTWQNLTATSGTDVACTTDSGYVGSVTVPANATVTGIKYLVGSAGGTDKVIASLHSADGTKVAESAQAGATVGTAAEVQTVALTSTYDVTPGLYWIAVTFNGITAKFRAVPAQCQAGVYGNSVTQTFGTSADFTAPTAFTADKVPIASLY